MPVISPSERDLGGAHPLLDGVSPTIGWQLQPQAKGGLSFVILRRTGLGGLKVVESFPLTEDGWAHAWQSLATHNTVGHPGNVGGHETWEDAGSWRHSGSTRMSCANAR
jgi:hypothetical protein